MLLFDECGVVIWVVVWFGCCLGVDVVGFEHEVAHAGGPVRCVGAKVV